MRRIALLLACCVMVAGCSGPPPAPTPGPPQGTQSASPAPTSGTPRSPPDGSPDTAAAGDLGGSSNATRVDPRSGPTPG